MMNCKPLNPDASAALSLNRFSLPPPIRTLASHKGLNKQSEALNNFIALTFDDGPDPIYTPKILDVLAEFDVKATFFVLGAAAEQHPDLLIKMMRAGHTIGNHTYSHCHPWIMSSARAIDEVTRTSAVINAITGRAPRWFRPPFGRLRTAMRKQAQVEQMATVLWSRSIIDWGPLGNKTGVGNRLGQIQSNDIVLMHDGKREHNHPDIIVQCLPQFLKSLPDKSLTACSLDDLY